MFKRLMSKTGTTLFFFIIMSASITIFIMCTELQKQIKELKYQVEINQIKSNEKPQLEIKDKLTLEKDILVLEKDIIVTIIQLSGGGIFLLTAYFTWLNAQEKQITERFSSAIALLGNTDIHVRIGAIYALERISKDSDKDYWQIIEVLTAYIREKCLLYTEGEKKETSGLPIDIQAVLTVIVRRSKSYGRGEKNILNLAKSNLGSSDLSGSDFSVSDFSGANLNRANLSGANLSGANFSGANLNRAKLIRANLKSTKLSDADLSYCDFTNAKLINAKLNNARLINAKLIDVDLINADLNSSDLSNSDLSSSDFTKANLTNANLTNTKLIDAKLSRIDLSGSNLSRSSLNHSDLTKANLTNANLNRAEFSDANLTYTNFIGADLSHANLSSANLSHANLSRANLSRANFFNAKNLTPRQVKLAQNWEQAIYDEEFRKLLGLPDTGAAIEKNP